MLKELNTDVWAIADESSAICILTNNMILADNRNIMGGGIAREAKDRNPLIDYICAESIRLGTFSLGYDNISKAELLRFPTKNKVWEPSELAIIADSLNRLVTYCKQNPNKKVYLPRPGCGLGGLDWEIDGVKELCESYLNDIDNVFIIYK